MNVVGCSINGVGMGHVMRMTALLTAIRDLAMVQGVVHATSSHATFVSHSAGIPTVRMNSYEDLIGFDEALEPGGKLITPDLTTVQLLRAANRATWREVVNRTTPEIVFIDAFPFGPLDSVTEVDCGSAVRLMVNGSFKSDMSPYDPQALRAFDGVVVPWPEELASYYPGDVPDQGFWSGFIANDAFSRFGRDEARQILGLPLGEALVLVNVGGSESVWSKEFTASVVGAVSVAGLKAAVPRPPLGSASDGVRPPEPSSDDSWYSFNAWPLSRYLNAFDVIVSTTGMNSLPEIVRSGIPCLYVARGDVWASDQPGLLLAVEDLGLGAVLRDSDRQSVILAIEEAMHRGQVDQSVRASFDRRGEIIAAQYAMSLVS